MQRSTTNPATSTNAIAAHASGGSSLGSSLSIFLLAGLAAGLSIVFLLDHYTALLGN